MLKALAIPSYLLIKQLLVMKSRILLLFCIGISTLLSAQSTSVPTKFKLKKIGISFGVEEDMINGLDYNYLVATAKGNPSSELEGMDFTQDYFSGGVCENPHIRVTAALEVPGMRNTELNIALLGIFNRLDGSFYQSNGRMENDFEYVGVSTMTNEIALESSLTKRLTISKFINLYGGAGLNLGYNFGGHLSANGMRQNTVDQNSNRPLGDIVNGQFPSDENYFNEFYQLKDGISNRAFLQAGIGFVLFRRLEIGMDYRYGIGYRATFDAPTKRTNLNSVALSTRWVFK